MAPWGKDYKRLSVWRVMLLLQSSTPLYGTLFRSPRPTFTSGQPYLMLLDLSWHRVTRTKVCLPFMSPALSPGLLMNITDRFTENLKMLAAGSHCPLRFSQEDDDPQRKCFLLQALHFFCSVHPFIAHVTGNGTSRLKCVIPALYMYKC